MRTDINPNLLGITYENNDYAIINYVYKYHPYFDCENSDKLIADLYKRYGISMIKNMVFIAKEAKKIYDRIKSLENELYEYKRDLSRYKDGTFTISM